MRFLVFVVLITAEGNYGKETMGQLKKRNFAFTLANSSEQNFAFVWQVNTDVHNTNVTISKITIHFATI